MPTGKDEYIVTYTFKWSLIFFFFDIYCLLLLLTNRKNFDQAKRIRKYFSCLEMVRCLSVCDDEVSEARSQTLCDPFLIYYYYYYYCVLFFTVFLSFLRCCGQFRFIFLFEYIFVSLAAAECRQLVASTTFLFE